MSRINNFKNLTIITGKIIQKMYKMVTALWDLFLKANILLQLNR